MLSSLFDRIRKRCNGDKETFVLYHKGFRFCCKVMDIEHDVYEARNRNQSVVEITLTRDGMNFTDWISVDRYQARTNIKTVDSLTATFDAKLNDLIKRYKKEITLKTPREIIDGVMCNVKEIYEVYEKPC